MATTEYWYVDPDATGSGTGGDGTNNSANYANAYTTLDAAEQAKDADITAATGSDKIIIFRCRSLNGTADGTAVAVNGWMTAAGNYVQIETQSSESTGRHAGVWSTSKYRIEIANASAFAIQEDYVRLDGLQILVSAENGNYQAPLQINTVAASNDVRVGNTILRCPGGANREPVVYINDADLIVTFWNCIMYGSGGSTNALSSAIAINAATTVNIYGCTLIGGYAGVRNGSASCTVNAKNTYGYGTTAGFSNAGTLNSSYCASNTTELSGTGDVDSVPYTTDTFQSVTPATDGTGDYLKVKSGGGLHEAGTTLNDDPPGSTALSVDIAGNSRS